MKLELAAPDIAMHVNKEFALGRILKQSAIISVRYALRLFQAGSVVWTGNIRRGLLQETTLLFRGPHNQSWNITMKESIHQKYQEITATCVCGAEVLTGSTKPSIRVEICSSCHPFYTGQQKIVDTEGRVDRFVKRYKLDKKEEAEAKILEKYLPTQLSDQELQSLVDEAITEVGASTISDMGKVIPLVMSKAGQSADGSRVSALVRQKLTA